MSRPLPEKIVDVLLEGELDDFVAHGLGATDPFASIGKVVIAGPDNRRLVNHNYVGKIWRCHIVIDWNPVNKDFKVDALLDHNTKTIARNFNSLWTLEPQYLERANKACIQLVRDFHVIADTMDVRGWNDQEGQRIVWKAGDDAMLRLDDEFYQMDSSGKI